MLLVCIIYTFIVLKIGWKLIRTSMCFFRVVEMSSDSREQICEWNFCQWLKLKCLSDLTTSLIKMLSHWNMARIACRNIFYIITCHFISAFHHSTFLLFSFITEEFKSSKACRSKFLLLKSILSNTMERKITFSELIAHCHVLYHETQQQMTSQPLNTLSFSVIWHFLLLLSRLMRQSLWENGKNEPGPRTLCLSVWPALSEAMDPQGPEGSAETFLTIRCLGRREWHS